MQSPVRFNRVPEKRGGLGAKPSQVQHGFEEGSGEGLGGFGAEPGQVQCGFGEGSGQSLGGFFCRAMSGSTGFRRSFPETLVQKTSQVQRVPEKVAEKVPEKVLGIFGPGQVQQVQQGFQCLASHHGSERFVKIKRCGGWGFHRSLFFTLKNQWGAERTISQNWTGVIPVGLVGCVRVCQLELRFWVLVSFVQGHLIYGMARQ